jgi:transporter family-2 protein
VSGGNALAVLLALAAGLAASVQAAIVGRFGDRIGGVEALGCSMVVAGVTGTLVLLVSRQSLHGLAAGGRQPAWYWLGGISSVFIVLCLIVATPRVGVAATVGLLIGGQLVMAAVIDRFGLFGVEQVALHWPRLLGIALLAAGAALSLKR